MEWVYDIRLGKRYGEIPFGKCELDEFLFQNITFCHNDGHKSFEYFAAIGKRSSCKIENRLNALAGMRIQMRRLIGNIARGILIGITKIDLINTRMASYTKCENVEQHNCRQRR